MLSRKRLSRASNFMRIPDSVGLAKVIGDRRQVEADFNKRRKRSDAHPLSRWERVRVRPRCPAGSPHDPALSNGEGEKSPFRWIAPRFPAVLRRSIRRAGPRGRDDTRRHPTMRPACTPRPPARCARPRAAVMSNRVVA